MLMMLPMRDVDDEETHTDAFLGQGHINALEDFV